MESIARLIVTIETVFLFVYLLLLAKGVERHLWKRRPWDWDVVQCACVAAKIILVGLIVQQYVLRNTPPFPSTYFLLVGLAFAINAARKAHAQQ